MRFVALVLSALLLLALPAMATEAEHARAFLMENDGALAMHAPPDLTLRGV